PDQPRHEAPRKQGVPLESGEPQRALVRPGAVEIPHENPPRQHIRRDDMRPRDHGHARRAAEQQARIEHQLLRHETERHAEQQPWRQPQCPDCGGHRDAEQREHREVHHGVSRHDPERGCHDVLACERSRQHRRCVERSPRQRVDHEKPQGDRQPREQAADRAVSDTLVDGWSHRSLRKDHAYSISRGAARAQPAQARPMAFPAGFPILVSHDRRRHHARASTPELPPGLLEDYLEGMRGQLGALARVADHLDADGGDQEALEQLRRETHKIHGSAGSFGFWNASRLAAGMEVTAKDWLSRPGDTDVERGALTRWFVARLAEIMRLDVPATPRADPLSSPMLQADRLTVPDVIVVEDDPALAELLEYGLRSRAYRFASYRNGREALTDLLALETEGA